MRKGKCLDQRMLTQIGKARKRKPTTEKPEWKEEIEQGNIDEALIPLIKALNEAGLKTNGCCEGHGTVGEADPDEPGMPLVVDKAWVSIKIESIDFFIARGSLTIYWDRRLKEKQ